MSDVRGSHREESQPGCQGRQQDDPREIVAHGAAETGLVIAIEPVGVGDEEPGRKCNHERRRDLKVLALEGGQETLYERKRERQTADVGEHERPADRVSAASLIRAQLDATLARETRGGRRPCRQSAQFVLQILDGLVGAVVASDRRPCRMTSPHRNVSSRPSCCSPTPSLRRSPGFVKGARREWSTVFGLD